MIKNTVASHTETIRLEKIYAMADVAFKEGHVRFSASQACDHQRRIRFAEYRCLGF